MQVYIINFLIGILLDSVKSYVKNSSSSVDDKVLDLVKVGSVYLATKTNNTITNKVAKELNKTKMTFTQRSK